MCFVLVCPASDISSGKFKGLSLTCHYMGGRVSDSGQPVIPCLLQTMYFIVVDLI